MTSIHQALRHQLQSLSGVLLHIDDNAYNHCSKWLSNASIGQHSRHVIELIQCLVNGYEEGLVSYDNRKRDKVIETDRQYAIHCIEELLPAINQPDKNILIEGSFDIQEDVPVKIASTYNRELAYNIEHAVHHMALIKVSLKELAIDIVAEDFGVAYATIQYRRLCAQ